MKNELEDALLFFSLPVDFSSEDLKKRYRELALKYHPDRGEYTSDILFIQLMNYNSLLEEFLKTQNSQARNFPNESQNRNSGREEYTVYKDAKQRESDAILGYFKSRKNLTKVELDETKNRELLILREKLEKVKKEYEEYLKKYPSSIWIQDIYDSLENLKVWWK